MKRLFLFFIIVVTIGISGCGSSSSDSPLYNNDDYIDSIPGDTTPVTNLATAPSVPSALPMLVILLEYNNQLIISNDAVWAQKIFGEQEGELNDYYEEISYGKFHFVPASENYGSVNDGIIKVHLNKNHIDTDIDSPNFFPAWTTDIQNALSKADSYINFSNYDSNGDGALQSTEIAIIFVVAGYEDAYEGHHVTNGIWAHQSFLPASDAPVLDGVSIFNENKGGRYAVFGELHDIASPHNATIGIIAHELGHAVFNLPDLYNTTPGATTGGIGIFGLMGAGTWTRKDAQELYGSTPVHMCAWSKSYIGWVQPEVLSDTSATLNESASSSYNVIKLPISANHYYLLENRNDSGYDRGLRYLDGDFKGGMLIWHIDQTKLTVDHFENNTVNADTSDKGVDVVEAVDPVLDSVPNVSGDAKALFFNPNRTSFGSKVTDISAPGSVMNLNIH